MSIFKISDNSTVIIRDDQSGNTIAKTRIQNYDSVNNSILVDGMYFSNVENQKVFLLIIDGDNIIECMGMVRKQGVRGMREISLYRTKVKEEDRGAVRYSLTAPAVIETMLVEGRRVPLSSPLEVIVDNISTSGILLNVKGDFLNVNSSFQLKLNISDSYILIDTTVVRIVSEGESGKKLGCSFISLSE